MRRFKKFLPLIILAAVIVAALSWFLMGSNKSSQDRQEATPSTDSLDAMPVTDLNTTAPDTPDTPVSSPSEGRYTSFSSEKSAETGYSRTLLFFHAPWCPQCRAFEKNITAEAANIPAGTQILVVDYDSATELRQKYGVTLQTTFVRVDASGNLQKKWVGYTSNHTLSALLQQFEG